MKRLKTLIIAASMAIASPALSLTATFDFTTPTGPSEPPAEIPVIDQPVTFTADTGLTATLQGNLASGFPATLFTDFAGLGPNTIDITSRIAALFLCSNTTSCDQIRFVFPRPVKLTEIVVTNYSLLGGTLDVRYGDAAFDERVVIDEGVPGGSNEQILEFTGQPFTDRFIISSGGDAGFSIKTLSVVPVPVPATLPLLAGALIGGGFVLRRRSEAKQA